MKVVACLALLVLLVGCRTAPSQQTASRPSRSKPAPGEDPVPAGRISTAKAIELAKARLAEDPHAKLFHPDQFVAGYQAAKDVYTVDFRNVGNIGDEILPGMWGAGFLVVVNAVSGTIEYANGYKR